MAMTSPGWYDDGHGALRWWDGAQWTEHVATPDPETPDGDPAPTEAEIVAASEAEAAAQPAAAEANSAAALGLGFPPAAGPADFTPHPDHPQGAYPGGYPGADASAGAFAAATGARKSKLWVLWVVLGVVMLGIVIAAAIVIPLLFLNMVGGSQGAVQPSGADQEGAVSAVELYDDAWQSADCDAYTASTTEDFRGVSGLTDCETFSSSATEFSASVQNYEVTVTQVESTGDSVQVTTTETYDALFDENSEPLDEPQAGVVHYEYTVVDDGGDWHIDDLADLDD